MSYCMVLSAGLVTVQCTCPYFSGVFLLSLLRTSKPLAPFPHNYPRNSGPRCERNEFCCNDYHQSMKIKMVERGSNQRPPLYKSCALPTEQHRFGTLRIEVSAICVRSCTQTV